MHYVLQKYINRVKVDIRPVVVTYCVGDRCTDTIPLYINYLHKSGYLERTSRGVYKRIHEIPPDLTLTKIKDAKYRELLRRYWKMKKIKENIR